MHLVIEDPDAIVGHRIAAMSFQVTIRHGVNWNGCCVNTEQVVQGGIIISLVYQLTAKVPDCAECVPLSSAR